MLLLSGVSASADLVTWIATIQVDTVDDPFDMLGGSIAPGDLMTGTISYDTSLTDDSPSDTEYGNYNVLFPTSDNWIEGKTASGDGFYESTEYFGVQVYDPAPQTGFFDTLSFFSSGDTIPSLLQTFSVDTIDLDILFIDNDASALAGDSLPVVINLADFDEAYMEMEGYSFTPGGGYEFGFSVSGTVTALRSVPEPSSLCTLTVVAAGMLPPARRRRLLRSL